MKTWIALLRGINVGGNHIIPMKELVRLMEEKGFLNVKTYIQSGNVVFQSPATPKDEIGLLIEERFGFRPDIFILSGEDFKKSVANNPYHATEGKTVHFFFCDKTPMIDYAFLESLRAASEEYKLVENVFYLYAPEGIGRSKLVEKMGKTFKGVSMTARNLNTIRKLLEMI
ncbi:MAG: DUF1697 domain-containing protein [Bacteroidia bacterium]|nr:DUF1697 domain-containing protein [Bacteroidia bacterium]